MASAAPPSAAPARIDRQKTPPFLLKLFYRQYAFHRLDEFTPGAHLPQHLQIYTWPSCTLRELTHLLTSAMPHLLPNPAAGTRIAFRLVFPDTRPGGRPDAPGRFVAKDLGSVVVGREREEDNAPEQVEGEQQPQPPQQKSMSKRLVGDAERQLQDARFVIGDYISCAILPPLPNGMVAPPPGPSGAPPRGNMYGGPPPPRAGYRSSRGGGSGGGGGGGGGMRAFGNGEYASGGPGGPGGGGFGVPSGDWRRGERVPDGPHGAPYRGRGRPRW